MHLHSSQLQRVASSRGLKHARPLAPPCAAGGRTNGATGRQQQGRARPSNQSSSAGRRSLAPGTPSSNAQQQQMQANRGRPRQHPGPVDQLDSPGVAMQQPAADLYVAESWEISEPWDEPSGWQGPESEPYLQQQRALQGPATGAGGAAAADLQESLDSLDWLLEDEEEDEGFEFESDSESDSEDGWLLDQPGSSDVLQQQDTQQRLQQPQPAQQQQQQQLMLEGQRDVQAQTWQQPQLQQQQQSLPAAPVDLQADWEAALAVSLDLLASYDVRYDVNRRARISSSAAVGRAPGRSWQQQRGEPGLGPDEVSLTAAAVAAARAGRRRRRRQAPAAPLLQTDHQQQQQQQQELMRFAVSPVADAGILQQQDPLAQQQQQQQQSSVYDLELFEELPLPEDPRWLAVSRTHAAYLSYMQQLAAMTVNKQQQQHQLVYQVGISDSWVQLSHLLQVFGGKELTPPVVAAMWKRLAAIINRKVFVRMSHAERCHYDAFIERLVMQSITTLQRYSKISTSSSNSTSSSLPPVIQATAPRSSSAAGRNRGDSSAAGSIYSPVLPVHLAAVAYGMAVLGARSGPLAAAVVEASAGLLARAAAAAATSPDAMSGAASSGAGQAAVGFSSSSASSSSSRSSSAGASAAAAAAAAAPGGWGPGEVSSLMWGLGTVGHTPPADWLQDMQVVSRKLMPRCQPAQLWGVLWGFAQFSYPPEESYMASWLAAAQQQLDGFNAEGLAHSIWALAALGHVPHKLWLRAYCGMVAYKIKSFVAGQLAMVLPALSTLGYKPRPELRRTMVAQVRRHLHTYSPSQLVSVLAALASYPPGEGEPASTSGWHPGRLFLYDFITQSSRPDVLTAWSGRQAAQVLWAYSRFRYVPDRSYVVALLAHLQMQLPLCDADALSMAVWALAALRQPLPSAEWGAQWCEAAVGAAGEFGPQALAHGLSGMAALRMQPPAELMQGLTRSASGCLSSFSCMELGLMAAALADLHWRPSDAWMTAFVSQVAQQLPAFENEDYGLLLYGLASLAQPLHPNLLARFCREARRKLYGLSGEGLGLLVWGLAQYGYDGMPDAEQWWAALFTECSSKWSSAGLRGSALMALGLAQLGPRYAPPGEWESDWVERYKVLVQAKPQSWDELVVGFRAAAGLEPAEVLPTCFWLCGLLLRLGKAWGLRLPGDQSAAEVVSVAALIERVNVRVAATAAAVPFGVAAGEMGYGSTEAGDPAGLRTHVEGDVEPTSATAVLL